MFWYDFFRFFLISPDCGYLTLEHSWCFFQTKTFLIITWGSSLSILAYALACSILPANPEQACCLADCLAGVEQLRCDEDPPGPSPSDCCPHRMMIMYSPLGCSHGPLHTITAIMMPSNRVTAQALMTSALQRALYMFRRKSYLLEIWSWISVLRQNFTFIQFVQ